MVIIVVETKSKLSKENYDAIASEIETTISKGGGGLIVGGDLTLKFIDGDRIHVVRTIGKLTKEAHIALKGKYEDALTKRYLILDGGATIEEVRGME